MVKRPLFLAAVILAAVFFIIIRIFPALIIPAIAFEDQEQIVLTGQVYRIEQKKSSMMVYLSDVRAESRSRSISQQLDRAVLAFDAEAFGSYGIKTGNRLYSECVYTTYNKARNYGNYDEENYYYSKGIFLKASEISTEVTDGSVNKVRQFLNDLRERMVSSIYEAVDDDETAGILAAICTGDRSGLTDETKIIYQYSGIIHVLAVSGLHISLIGMSIFRLLRKKFRFAFSAALSLTVMAGFCIMSSSSPSAVRATIMFAVQIAGTGLGKTYDILCSLSLAVIIMLITDPVIIMDSGFILSVAAILSVGTIFRSLRDLFTTLSPENRSSGPEISPAKKRLRAFIHRLLPGVLMSISINLGTLPLIAGSYYEIPLYSILLNILIIPLMSGVLGAGLFSSVMGMLNVFIGRFFAGAGVYMVRFIRWACLAVSELPYSRIVTGCPSAWQVCCYYLMMIIGTVAVNIYVRFKNGSGRVSSRICTFTAYVACAVMLLFWRFRGGAVKILFLDVGQGDCILLESTSGTNYMIDGGSSSENDVARYRMSGAVKYEGISVIDYAIVTHPDTDHISGLTGIIENMNDGINALNIVIKNILIPKITGNENYEKLLELASANGIDVINIRTGTVINDEGICLRCLHPDALYESEDSNAYSAVMEMSFGGFSALFTGDLEADGEEILLSDNRLGYSAGHLNAGDAVYSAGYDLLKVAHHGSRFSSSESFLDAVSPEISVISAGVNNPYGHPHAETLARLEAAGSTVYTTSDCGEIIITVSRDGRYKVETKFE